MASFARGDALQACRAVGPFPSEIREGFGGELRNQQDAAGPGRPWERRTEPGTQRARVPMAGRAGRAGRAPSKKKSGRQGRETRSQVAAAMDGADWALTGRWRAARGEVGPGCQVAPRVHLPPAGVGSIKSARPASTSI
jgi:hypothetical protein